MLVGRIPQRGFFCLNLPPLLGTTSCWGVPSGRCGRSGAHLDVAVSSSVGATSETVQRYRASTSPERFLAGICDTKALVLLYAGRRDEEETAVKNSRELHEVYVLQICCFISIFFFKYICLTANKRSGSTELLNFFPQEKRRFFSFCACVLAYLPNLEVIFQARMSQFNWGRSLNHNLQTRWKWNILTIPFQKIDGTGECWHCFTFAKGCQHSQGISYSAGEKVLNKHRSS